jgi:hypothetical protein
MDRLSTGVWIRCTRPARMARRRQIRGQFLIEAMLLSMLGGPLGAVLGVAVTTGYAAIRRWPAVLPAGVLTGGVMASVAVGHSPACTRRWCVPRASPRPWHLPRDC